MKKTIRNPLLLGIFLLTTFSSFSHAQTAYRWVDAQGKVHFSDHPPPATVQEVERKNYAPNQSDPTLPYTLRKLASDFPVALFTSENCGSYCDKARELLTQRGIPFSEKAIVTKEDRDAYVARFNTEDIPTLTVGKNVITRFEAVGWNNLLDSVGYPKSPPK